MIGVIPSFKNDSKIAYQTEFADPRIVGIKRSITNTKRWDVYTKRKLISLHVFDVGFRTNEALY